jgi:hypothetical protein
VGAFENVSFIGGSAPNASDRRRDEKSVVGAIFAKKNVSTAGTPTISELHVQLNSSVNRVMF